MENAFTYSQGERIRSLLSEAKEEVKIIAPFIKVDALKSLINDIPVSTVVSCITRWHLKEVVAGVSDPEILEVLETRGNFNLHLVDQLHAKIFIADSLCLAGSVNVTLAGFGETSDSGNIEILLETNINDQSIIAVLEKIEETKREATNEMMQTMLRFSEILTIENIQYPESSVFWFPISRNPHKAYQFYCNPPRGYVKTADKMLIQDIINLNFAPGLKQKEFNHRVRSAINSIPFARSLLYSNKDIILTKSDIIAQLETLSSNEFSSNDLWLSFVEWVVAFFDDKVVRQEIIEVALRRAQIV